MKKTITLTIVLSLMVGLMAGYLYGRSRSKEQLDVCYQDLRFAVAKGYAAEMNLAECKQGR